jgi:AcrR family transcriptional regulator
MTREAPGRRPGRRHGGHSGRRPGANRTREAILVAARECFAAGGFDHATIRDIGARADVDPALVHHYFGTKERLFEAALELPLDPAVLLPQLMKADRARVGEQVVRQFLYTWEAPENLPVFLAMLRSVVGDERAAALVRDLLTRVIFAPFATVLDVPDARLRANLIGTQLIGLALARYVGRIEPLASSDIETVVAAVGPTVQRYLMGDLG